MKVTSNFIKENGTRYLLKSDDDYLIRDFVGQVCSVVKGSSPIYCRGVNEYLKAFHSESLFDDNDNKKVLVFLDFSKDDVDTVNSLLGVLTEDYQVLVERSAIPRTKSYTRIKSSYKSIKLDAPKDQACTTWVRKELTARGVDFTEDVPEAIVKRRGADIQALSNEVRKVSLAFPGKQITSQDCLRVVSDGGESQMFSFMENFFRRRVRQTFDEFSKMNEYTYVKLIHFMIGQVEKVYQVSIHKESGKSPQDIAELMGLPPFILKTKYFTVLATYSKTKLLRLIDLLNEADFRIRTSSLPNKTLLESYLLKALKL